MEKVKLTRQPIHKWRAEERPRERLLSQGSRSLLDHELLALLLGTGTRSQSAVELAVELIRHFGGLPNLADATVKELSKMPGVGPAKASMIVAAFELGRRRQLRDMDQPLLNTSLRTGEYLIAKIGAEVREIFYTLFFDSNGALIAERELFSGSAENVAVDIRLIFREAMGLMARSVIVAHNHPSGNVRPSNMDDQLTKRLVMASIASEIVLRDHFVVTRRKWYSYKDQGLLDDMRYECQRLLNGTFVENTIQIAASRPQQSYVKANS